MRAVNLIPEEQRGDAAMGGGRSGGGAYVVLGLIAGLTVLALLYGIARHNVSSKRSELSSIQSRVSQATTSAGQLAQYTSFISASTERTKTISQLAASRFAWASTLHELGRVLPTGVSIASLEGTVGSLTTPGASSSPSSSSAKGSAAGSITPPGSVPLFTLSGCATNQATVAKMLNRLKLISGVSEAALQASASGGGAAASGSTSSSSCSTSAPSFTVKMTFSPLPSAAPASAGASSATSDASNSTLRKAEATGGAR